MLQTMWQDDAWRALAGGAIYLIIYALAGQLLWGLRRWAAECRPTSTTHALLASRAWPLIEESLRVAVALSFPLLMAARGQFSPGDIGLRALDWSATRGWILVGTVATSVWIALLWGLDGRPGGLRQRNVRPFGLPAIARAIAEGLQAEGSLATLRGALLPLIPAHWGVWIGVLLRMVLSRTDPRLELRHHDLGGRRIAYLDWALDWVSSAAYLLTGSLWPSLFVRLACRVLLQVTALRVAAHPPVHVAEVLPEESLVPR